MTFDPERTEADEMFPADIFQPTSQSISPSVEETTQQSPNRIPSPVEGTPETSNEGSVMDTMEYDDQDNYHHKDLVEQFKSLTEVSYLTLSVVHWFILTLFDVDSLFYFTVMTEIF